MNNYYVVVRYPQLIPSGFGAGEDTFVFDDFLSADAFAEKKQVEEPSYWWKVEVRHYGPQG